MDEIKKARIGAGLSQVAAAKIFDVTEKTFIGWEKGHVTLKPYQKNAIIRELNEHEINS